jgi:hypothetical protein
MRRSVTWRLFAVCWSVLQFALSGVALLADARLERESISSPGAHVEADGSRTCRPAHPDECALCHVISRTAPPSENPELPAIAVVVRPSAASPIPQCVTRDLGVAARPRAPPSLT